MNLRQIQQFLVVCEARNLSKAAERLHIAQPPLSVSMKRLEDELGNALFVRERRGVRLTAIGEAVLPSARQIAFHADQLRKAAADAAGGIGGTLRIGFIGSATYELFPRTLPLFREKYPSVLLDLRERSTAQILRELAHDELDIGLIRYPVFESTNARLVPVEMDTLVAALPARSPLALRKRLRLQDLADEPFILYSASLAPNLRGQVTGACQAAGFTPRVVQEAVQVQTIVSLVESGIGVALVPSICKAQASSGVVFRPLAGIGRRLTVAIAVATRADTESRAAAHFRDLLLRAAPSPQANSAAAERKNGKRRVVNS